MLKTSTLVMALSIVVMSVRPAAALSLSDIELNSGLNQPLDAKVILLAVDNEELNSLQVKINNADLAHAVMQDENGHYIHITSRNAIKEPILSFTLEIDWSQGRLIRDFSLLIDPRQSNGLGE
jgi:pilus assembly protein FimV